MVCAWAWRVAGTRAYTATRIRHLLGDRRRAGQVALPGPANQQLIGLSPPALAVVTRAGLAADGPGPGHRAIHGILGDLVLKRRDRQCQRVKKPPKNTFPSRKRDEARLPGKAKYKIKITCKDQLPAGTP
jgi:hypothetical protein